MRHKWMGWVCGAALAVSLLTGCGGGQDAGAPAPAEALDTLSSQLQFTDEMTEKDLAGACTFYGVDETLVTDAAALVGSGATAESLSVWQTADQAAAQDVADALETFRADWAEGYADYKPEEVPKLDSAVLAQQGTTVVFCVTADNEGAWDAVQALLGQ